jgi:hypothetical protein
MTSARLSNSPDVARLFYLREDFVMHDESKFKFHYFGFHDTVPFEELIAMETESIGNYVKCFRFLKIIENY